MGRYWIEALANIPCHVEIASEYRYRDVALEPNTLFITLSQSGETADTLAALHKAKTLDYLGNLTICNVPESSLVRASDCAFMARAGVEIGVASTKAFTTQLTALLMLTLSMAEIHNKKSPELSEAVSQLRNLPKLTKNILKLDSTIKSVAKLFHDKHSTLFLGRGIYYPIAMEGALKLKELSYIHAEAYPGGELKHGPLALIDKDMLIVAIAPTDALFPKISSNLNEARTRGGKLLIFTDEKNEMENNADMTFIKMPVCDKNIAPIVYTIPLQLLAYHVAVQRGTDIDQPRNLAKSVTVE